MLLNLHVKNLAIIEETEVDFAEGLNILSGETGAGKSIIIDSINLALGEKMPKEMVRDESRPAFVELVFQVTDEEQVKSLQDMEVYPENDQVILSRKVVNGRSIGKINSESVAISKMREVAGILIDIHGQHEHQSLLHKTKHLEILDDYAKERLSEPKQRLKEAFKEYQHWKTEFSKQDLDEEQQKRELSFLEYELNEIQEAALRPGEDQELEIQYKRLVHGKKIIEALTGAYAQTGASGNAASEQIDRALRELLSVASYDETVEGFSQQLQEIDNLLNDLNREISAYMSGADFDEQTFREVEERLDLINHMKSKYGDTIEKVLAAASEREKKIEQLQDYDNYLKKLQQNLDEAYTKVINISDEVSCIRQTYAKELTKAVKTALVDLNFLDVQFEMDFQKCKAPSSNGTDDAQFIISTNPGEPMRALGKVASGGELSRIMLAIKSVLAQNDKIETLIFDEIDSGISGRTAQAVSEKMSVIGRNHQIICITHLPQIAAMADAHYLIEKVVENNSTRSRIVRLSETDSISELARMLGGVKITDTVLESAREMKELANSKKC